MKPGSILQSVFLRRIQTTGYYYDPGRLPKMAISAFCCTM